MTTPAPKLDPAYLDYFMCEICMEPIWTYGPAPICSCGREMVQYDPAPEYQEDVTR